MQGLNAYIATGSYKKQRTQKECRAKRAWYIDIDCKPGKEYDTKTLGMEAVKEALKLGLPKPSIIVDTGNGFHIYWVIDTDINEPLWLDIASQVEAACSQLGLRIDPTSTKDAARILRAPETVNWKDPKDPKPCKIKYDKGQVYTHKELQTLFQRFHAPAQKPRVSNVVNLVIPAGMPDDLWAGLPERDTKPTKAQDMIDQCPLYGEAVTTGGAQHQEPLWRGLIQTLVYVDDGREFIHEISNQHPDYNEHAVNTKYNRALGKKADTGPYKCETFAKNSSVCQTCPYYGTITTPLALAYGKKSLLPYPYRDGTYGVELLDPEEDEWTMVIPYHITSLQMADVSGGHTLVKFVMDGEKIDTDMSQLIKSDLLAGVLAHHSLMLNPPNLDQMRRLMTAWTQQLRANKQVETATKEFGWVKGGFHYGGIIYNADGTETTSFKADQVLSDTFSPHGDIEPWRKCANHILSQPRHAVWTVMAASFGAPLMKFTGATGAVVSVVSQDTGTGKSTAMKVAQAVWGHPQRGMFMIDDTTNLVGHRMGALNNLPGFWDEVRETDQVHAFIKNIFRMGQGQEKKRLTSNITERDSGGWSTMLIVASNEALKDHIEQQIGNSDAGAARIFELYASAIKDPTMNNNQAQHMYVQCEENFGHAGAQYAKWLATNKEKAKLTVQSIATKLENELGSTPGERYWIASMACMIAGAAIVTSLGICKFDIKELKAYLIREMIKMRHIKKEEWQSPDDRALSWLVRFLHQHKDNTIKSENLPQRGSQAGKILAEAFRQPAVIRVATDSKMIRVIKKDFQKWMYDEMKGAGYGHIITDLKRMGSTEAKSSIDGGTKITSGRQWCMDFSMTAPAFKTALADWIED